MKLKQLTLRNFKGLKDFALEPNGEDTSIYADNGAGKTTLFDAFTWLLFEKDSLNRTNFDIKTLDESGQPIHGLEHEVEGVLEIEGNELTLRKVYAEKWTKKRGSASKEFTGHTTDYYIDSVPVKKSEYEARIASIVDESAFRLLTNPRHFNEVLHWQERRRILLEICGDVSDEDVIASDSTLAKLPGILQGRKLEDHRKVVAARRTEINKEIEKLPVRIDEIQRGLPEANEGYAIVTSNLAELKAGRQRKQEELVQLEAGGGVAEKTKALREIEANMLKLEREHWTKSADASQMVKVELNGVKAKANEMEPIIRSKLRHIEERVSAIAELEKQMAEWREEWQRINSGEFAYTESDTCPTCGQALPSEQVEAAREKALADFNHSKAQRLEAIQKKGKNARAKSEALAEEKSDLAREIEGAESKRTELEAEALKLQAKVDALEQQTMDYTEIPEHSVLLEEKAVIEQAITDLKEGSANALDALREEIRAIDSQISEKEGILAQIRQRESGLKRIEELKAQEKTLAAEYEKLEQELYLTEQFVQSKVSLLEEKINSKFKLARFKLFSTLVNGGIEECCETLYQGVPYNSALNNGARLNVGIDIINTLSEHYGFVAPIWLDNAEAVTQIIESKGQQIRLYVSEGDKVLRVEHAREAVAA